MNEVSTSLKGYVNQGIEEIKIKGGKEVMKNLCFDISYLARWNIIIY